MFKMLRNAFLAMIFVFLFALSGIHNANAADFEIMSVEVDDIVAGTDAIFAERESTLKIEVFLKGTGTSDDVRVEARIGGYEFGTIKEETDIFEVEPGVIYRKVFALEIPEDIEASDDYTLNIEVFDDDDEIEQEFTLRVDEVRHRLNILDILLRPGSNVNADEPLFVTVRVENLGQKKEEDIKVTTSIRELGISTSTFIDELTEEEVDDEDEESSMSSDELFLRIPSNVQSGVYTLDVDVEYNRGRSLLTESMQIFINGVSVGESAPVASVDAVSRSLDAEGSATWTIRVQNSGEQATFNVVVDGEKLFADSTVTPSSLSLGNGESGEFRVTLNANEEAEQGVSDFTARVMSGGAVVEEFALQANIVESESDTRDVLVIGFIVLVIVLIILGLIIAFQRMRQPEEPGEEGTSYY